MRYFSVEEAEALIPELEKVFTAALEIAARARLKAENLRRLDSADPPKPAEAAVERAQVEFLVNGINEWLGRIEALGGVVKGIEPPLVDFPSRLEGREVYLCWSLGEKAITQYHGVDEGFAGRRPLPRRRSS